jgi:hypothetical protein
MCYRQLPQELRLRGIQTIEEANRFPREPALPSLFAAFKWRRHSVAGSLLACLDSQNLDLIFSLQFQRMGNRDHTVSFQNLSLQIERVNWRGSVAGSFCCVGITWFPT